MKLKYILIGLVILVMTASIFISNHQNRRVEPIKHEAITLKQEKNLFDLTPDEVKEKINAEKIEIKTTDKNTIKSVIIRQKYNEDFSVFKAQIENLITMATKENAESILKELLPDKNPINYSKTLTKNGIQYDYVSLGEFGQNFRILKKEP